MGSSLTDRNETHPALLGGERPTQETRRHRQAPWYQLAKERDTQSRSLAV